MKERPIIFNAEMVRAILEGRKTQTRRLMKPQPTWSGRGSQNYINWPFPKELAVMTGTVKDLIPFSPYGQPGDRLWVKETWRLAKWTWDGDYDDCVIQYQNDNSSRSFKIPKYKKNPPNSKWKPSIHMPRWASRITLEITDVRVERIQDIQYEGIKAEGIFPKFICGGELRKLQDHYFKPTWNQIYPESWEKNDWVWVITFKVIRGLE